MKIHPHPRGSERGSVLLISLFTAVIIGVTLASYLILTQSQNISIARSQNWNSAIALAEAGAEEALAQLNRSAPYFEPSAGTNNLASNGWTDMGGMVFVSPIRFLGNDYYVATITFNGSTPVIYATGNVAMASSYGYAPSAMFAVAGVNGDSPWTYKSRLVKVNTKVDSLFSVAMAAKETIDLAGKNVTTDSFDSADPNFSNGGLYPAGDLNKTKANGDVCTDAVIIDSLDIGNAKIKGKAKTGPGGTIGIGPNGSVGDRAWVESGTKGIKDGWSANDFNVYFPDVTLPATTWYSVSETPGGGNGSPATINGIYYDHAFFSSGDYVVNTYSKLYIGTNANVRIKTTANIKLTGNNDQIRIAPVNASLRYYMVAASFSIKGQGVVNESGNAANFYYYGLPSNTSVDFGGNAAFTGAIYAPQAAFSLGGGGNDTYDFVGASVTRTVKMNGHFRFHYDENLARVGGNRGFIPINWAEK